MQVIEGTWEEIERHKAELIGRHLRVTVTPERPVPRKPSTPAKSTAKPKKLVGYGAFKGMFGGTKAILVAKQEEIELEERKFEPHP